MCGAKSWDGKTWFFEAVDVESNAAGTAKHYTVKPEPLSLTVMEGYYRQQGYHEGQRAEQQRAAGLIGAASNRRADGRPCWCGLAYEPYSKTHTMHCLALARYIAEAEATKKGER
jgi:hypothetical protein